MCEASVIPPENLDDTSISSESIFAEDFSCQNQLKSTLALNSKEEPTFPVNHHSNMNLKCEEFLLEASQLNFEPIGCEQNIAGNYDNYLGIALSHISKLKKLKFNYALESPLLY